MAKEDQKVGSSFKLEKVTFESSFQSSIGGGGWLWGGRWWWGWAGSPNRQEGQCLFVGPRAHPGLSLPHSVLGQHWIEACLWEAPVHKLHEIPTPG